MSHRLLKSALLEPVAVVDIPAGSTILRAAFQRDRRQTKLADPVTIDPTWSVDSLGDEDDGGANVFIVELVDRRTKATETRVLKVYDGSLMDGDDIKEHYGDLGYEATKVTAFPVVQVPTSQEPRYVPVVWYASPRNSAQPTTMAQVTFHAVPTGYAVDDSFIYIDTIQRAAYQNPETEAVVHIYMVPHTSVKVR